MEKTNSKLDQVTLAIIVICYIATVPLAYYQGVKSRALHIQESFPNFQTVQTADSPRRLADGWVKYDADTENWYIYRQAANTWEKID